MLQDLSGGNPIVVIAVFVAVVWLLVRYGNKTRSKPPKDDNDHGA